MKEISKNKFLFRGRRYTSSLDLFQRMSCIIKCDSNLCVWPDGFPLGSRKNLLLCSVNNIALITYQLYIQGRIWKLEFLSCLKFLRDCLKKTCFTRQISQIIPNSVLRCFKEHCYVNEKTNHRIRRGIYKSYIW